MEKQASESKLVAAQIVGVLLVLAGVVILYALYLTSLAYAFICVGLVIAVVACAVDRYNRCSCKGARGKKSDAKALPMKTPSQRSAQSQQKTTEMRTVKVD